MRPVPCFFGLHRHCPHPAVVCGLTAPQEERLAYLERLMFVTELSNAQIGELHALKTRMVSCRWFCTGCGCEMDREPVLGVFKPVEERCLRCDEIL